MIPGIKIFLLLSIFISPLFGNTQGFFDDEDDSDCANCLRFEYQGVSRQYKLYIPNSLPENAPLIFFLHGYMGSPERIYNYGFNEIADTAKFVVCYPLGSKDSTYRNHWNARLEISTTDDIGFLKALAIHLQKEYKLNPSRTFSTGFSNGGFMCYTLACEANDVFKGIASVSGTMSMKSWTFCAPNDIIPVLEIHGLKDYMVPSNGSMKTPGGWSGAPPLVQIIDRWAELNQCNVTDTLFCSENTLAIKHSNEQNNHEVWYYQIENFGHRWPDKRKDKSGIIAVEIIWDFFRKI